MEKPYPDRQQQGQQLRLRLLRHVLDACEAVAAEILRYPAPIPACQSGLPPSLGRIGMW